MSHDKLRENTTCQNCGDEVKVRFCPSCGQENTETKKSFHYLFTHFIEDLVHYDNGFWKAIKYLIFKPYILTIEYLNGKRKKYVAPVKLFIFMNFLCFFLSGMLSYETESIDKVKDVPAKKQSDVNLTVNGGSNSNFISKKLTELDKKYTANEIFEKAGENIVHYLPKVLFAYLPFFALFLWLFHNKKRWWYFDHGIFTFHFFSSILLLISIHNILDFILFKLEWSIIQDVLNLLLLIYIMYLFYKSHKQLYLETRLKSFLKTTMILFLNFILMGLVMLFLIIISIMYIK